MANLTETRNRIATLNSKIETLESERNKNDGMRLSIQNDLARLQAEYQQKYGIALLLDNVDAEIERVTADVEQKVDHVSNVVTAVEQGDYAKVEQLLKIKVETTSAVNTGVDKILEEQNKKREAIENTTFEVDVNAKAVETATTAMEQATPIATTIATEEQATPIIVSNTVSSDITVEQAMTNAQPTVPPTPTVVQPTVTPTPTVIQPTVQPTVAVTPTVVQPTVAPIPTVVQSTVPVTPVVPTAQPTVTPTPVVPTAQPVATPVAPTVIPTVSTAQPVATPVAPTATPTVSPVVSTVTPTAPTATPTASPVVPTVPKVQPIPTVEPSVATAQPTPTPVEVASIGTPSSGGQSFEKLFGLGL